VRLDGELDRNLVADDQAAVLQRAAEGDPEVTAVELGAGLKPVTETPGSLTVGTEVLEVERD